MYGNKPKIGSFLELFIKLPVGIIYQAIYTNQLNRYGDCLATYPPDPLPLLREGGV